MENELPKVILDADGDKITFFKESIKESIREQSESAKKDIDAECIFVDIEIDVSADWLKDWLKTRAHVLERAKNNNSKINCTNILILNPYQEYGRPILTKEDIEDKIGEVENGMIYFSQDDKKTIINGMMSRI